ncbi:N-acyl homoserine lactonase family protein [Cohnella lubricantis]|uniref:N-acyl homoserine lactonase family protein n=1 Tax=Cohnella lubricantis TaxID=2163172 RepID=A0A841TAT3_9BACL|nr:N-acyl homoserine lactonase family protein [Cohnella lubricantis]MBB6676360.1 N-acyl homoserine lactonase family protein [Cohnella lubricantis]MBP2118781.1 glyoxylase-like metal-dependent hydrolase (beta-lactamase superfamily II) [Cohnella lubricantis]
MNKISRIHILHTGYVRIDRALAYRERTLHPMPYTGWIRPASARITVPVSTYLIEHSNGPVLIDTGWHTDIRIDQRRHLGFLASTMFQGSLPEGAAIHEQLAKIGIRERDLEAVVLTHLHADHVSGLKHVAGAKRIIVSDLEVEAAQRSLGYNRTMWQGVKFDSYRPKSIPFGPYGLGLDLFGDESLYLVHTPGHSRGQLSVLVKLSGGWVLLASDVGYSTRSWREMMLPGVTDNREEAERSLHWVRDFASRTDCLGVYANHDPDVLPMVIEDEVVAV